MAKTSAAVAALAVITMASPASAHTAVPGPAAQARTTAAAGGVQYEDKWGDADPVLGNPTYWVYCHDSFATNYIYLQYDHSSCGTPGDAIGFALMTTNSGGSHTIEVCALDSVAASYFTEVVNPANPDGSASGETIWYTNYPDTFACLVRTLGYPIRKFQATAGGQGFSDWLAP